MERSSSNRNRRYCIAYWCLNSDKKNPNLSFFSLPKEEDRRIKWLKLIGRDDLTAKPDLKCKSYVVCSSHFDESQFRLVRHLKPDALPKADTAKDLAGNSNKIQGFKPKLLDSSAVSEGDSRKNKRKPELSSSIIKDPVYVCEESEDDVTNRFLSLIKWYNELKKTGGYRADKFFSLNLLIYSSQAYNCLKNMLKLPIKKILVNYKLNIPPNLDDKLLKFLEIKLKSLPDEAKFCIICLDKFPLKSKLYYDTKADEITGFHCINERKKTEIAKNACVIMIQGLCVKWQQPVAYALLGDGEYYDELDTWLDNVICKLTQLGIKIRAITSDNSPYFSKFVREVKNVTEFNPFILYNNTPIYYIFDVPHLMVSIRNRLLMDDLFYRNKRISWHYIDMLYQYDSVKETKQRLLPKLTSCHIAPKQKSEKNDVRFAVETLSRTVSSALHTYIDLGKITEEARPTAMFIETLNNLFDLLNSNKHKDENEIKCALTMTQNQQKVFKEAIDIFTVLKTSNEGADVIIHFLISIKSVKMLYENLKGDGFSNLLTRQLNKDCMTTFYKALTSEQNSSILSPIKFRRRFSKLIIHYLVKNNSTTRFGLDLCDALSKVEDVKTFSSIPEPSPTSAVALGPEADYQMQLPENNTLIYLSGYLLFKCARKHKCDAFGRFWDSCRDADNLNVFDRNLNRLSRFYGCLKIPPKAFIEYIQNLETTITQNLFRLIKKSPGTQLFKLLKAVPAKVPCSCFPLIYLLKLFVRLRIYETLKFNNQANSYEKKFLKIKHL